MVRNKENRQKWARENYANRRRHILSLKFEVGKCQMCGFAQHPEILEFHHIDKSTKETELSGSHLNRSLKAINEEISKCIIICSNCHKWIHYNERDWFSEKGRYNLKKTAEPRKYVRHITELDERVWQTFQNARGINKQYAKVAKACGLCSDNIVANKMRVYRIVKRRRNL